MLSDTSGKRLEQYVPDYVVFDLETTGISCMTDSVVEISAIRVRNGCPVGDFSMLVDPKRPIPLAASRVNGIYDHMVKGCPDFLEAFGAFLEFAGDDILVGHNIHYFDMRFLRRDALSYWGKQVGNDYVDTLQLARLVLPGLAHYRLTDLAVHYGISAEGAHRALNDCRMNQQVFELLGKEKQPAVPAEQMLCPKCGQVMRLRNGRFGEFWGCTGYPDCKYTHSAKKGNHPG